MEMGGVLVGSKSTQVVMNYRSLLCRFQVEPARRVIPERVECQRQPSLSFKTTVLY